MTAKVAKALIVVLVLATALLAGNSLVGGQVDTQATPAGSCCQGGNVKACSLGGAESCCQGQICPVPCPQRCGDEPCCLKTKATTGCPVEQQRPCCASK